MRDTRPDILLTALEHITRRLDTQMAAIDDLKAITAKLTAMVPVAATQVVALKAAHDTSVSDADLAAIAGQLTTSVAAPLQTIIDATAPAPVAA